MAVSKEFLDSDRVNFLVWRYLLEGNYRETAAKLQKEWNIQEPHRHFPFASHVKSHALVSVINRGLQYYALEREHERRQGHHDAAAAAEAILTGVFGPLVTQPQNVEADVEDEDEDAEGDEDDIDTSRKRQLDGGSRQHNQANGGSPAKRPRLSNGYENGAEATTTPMDVDHAGDSNHAYPSPLEGERASTPITRTEGPEQGTQVEKVEELAPRTTFLRLQADDSLPSGADGTSISTSSPLGIGCENAPILLHCEWHPRNPSILAAAGTDALARVWTLSRATAAPEAEPASGHVDAISRPYHNLVDDEMPRNASVTAIAWNSTGQAIAVATEHGSKARVNIWSENGAHIDRYEGPEPPIIKLRWNSNDSALLAIAPDAGGALVTIHLFNQMSTLTLSLPRHDLNSWPLDAVWTGETDFLLCGGEVLQHLRYSEAGILPLKSFDTRPEDGFTQVVYDPKTRLAATSCDKGVLDLWNEHGQRRSVTAHVGTMTAIQWQPLQSEWTGDERLIATGGEDGAITIWNALTLESTKGWYTMDAPIVALAFTPDGAFLAGATAGHVLIWKVGDSTVPRASWSRAPHPGWLSPKATPESEDEDEHCLSWDATGQKLAYGFNSRLAVIDFR